MEQLTIICVLMIAIFATTQCLRLKEDILIRNEDDYDNDKHGTRRERRSPVTKQRKNCNTWSSWINNNHSSDSKRYDTESASPQYLEEFCSPANGGNVSDIRCKYAANEELFDGNLTHENYNIYCSDPVHGVVCVPKKERCPDMMIQYYCSCPPVTTVSTTTVITSTTEVTATTTGQPEDNTSTTQVTATTTGQPEDNTSTTQVTATTTGQPEDNTSTTQVTATTTRQPEDTTLTTEVTATITGRPDIIVNNEVPSKDMEKTKGFPWWIPVAIVTCLFIAIITIICVYQHQKTKRPASKHGHQVHPLEDV